MLAGWTQLSVGAKPVEVFDPDGALPLCVLYLHSLHEESPAADATFTAALTQHRLRCLAPRGGACWWAARVCPAFDAELTPERYLLDVLVPWAAARWSLGPRAVAVAGAEMGGQGAVRLALKHPARFPVAASVSGAFDLQDWYGLGTPLDDMYDSRERCRLDSAVLHIDAREWPPHLWLCCAADDAATFWGNDRLHEKLSAMGVPHTAELNARPAYEMTGPMLGFVADALAKEARRLN
ncbi:MAG: alpha/beta hydrolase-fold protein [Gemmata sp.]